MNNNGGTLFTEKKILQRPKFGMLLSSDHPTIFSNREVYDEDDTDRSRRNSTASNPSSRFYNMSAPNSSNTSPHFMSPWNQPSPYIKSPWSQQFLPLDSSLGDANCSSLIGLIGSLVREEGHVYSLATSGNLLYTGSDSKNIRVWNNLKDYSGFKSNSGLVKAIVVYGDKVFTGHQDGKIRVWKFSGHIKKSYKRVGTLPTAKDYFKSSINPKSYVKVRRKRNVPWIKHFDTISCMSVDADRGLLYSGSWDKTLKVWRLSDSKCIESISAHDDAVNSVVVGFDGLIFTGSADGSVKAWRRELAGKSTKHVHVNTLLKQANAVTSLAVSMEAAVLYAGSSDGLVNFWEREKHFISYGGALRGHKLAVLCVAVGGSLVFSGSADKSICMWRREEGGIHTCVSVMTGHGGPVKCLAVEEDWEDDESDSDEGNRRWIVYSGSLDKSVNVWRVDENVPDLEKIEEE